MMDLTLGRVFLIRRSFCCLCILVWDVKPWLHVSIIYWKRDNLKIDSHTLFKILVNMYSFCFKIFFFIQWTKFCRQSSIKRLLKMVQLKLKFRLTKWKRRRKLPLKTQIITHSYYRLVKSETARGFFLLFLFVLFFFFEVGEKRGGEGHQFTFMGRDQSMHVLEVWTHVVQLLGVSQLDDSGYAC